MFRWLNLRCHIHHPTREHIEEGLETRQVLGGEAVMLYGLSQGRLETTQPLGARIPVDLEREMPLAHARGPETLGVQGSAPHDLHEKGRRAQNFDDCTPNLKLKYLT